MPSLKSGVGVRNKAVVYSTPLMRRRTALFCPVLHNNSLERDAAKSGGAPQLCR